MIGRPPRSTRTDTLFPYTTLFRSLGQLHAHAQAGLVDVDIVDHRVRPCEIDVFEDAWRIDRIGGALPLVQLAVERDQYRLTGRAVVTEFLAERIERNRHRSDQKHRTVRGFNRALDQCPEATHPHE